MMKKKVLSCLLTAAVLFGLAFGSTALSETGYAAGQDGEEIGEASDGEDIRKIGPRPREDERQIPSAESDEGQKGAGSSLPEVADETVTLMIYMVGSNLESDDGCASADLQEIVASGVDTDRCNVLVFTGGSAWWSLNVPNDCNTVYLLGEDDLYEVGSSGSELWDMGEAGTLTTFLDYGYETFPADHYALILWDHGGGPVWGYGNDELFDYDALEMDELAQALEDSVFGEQARFDWVGYDACLMGSIEVAAAWADYADYLIASEESEPGNGWDYSFLSVLNKTVDPEQICIAAADAYADSLESMTSWNFNPDYTISCMDLAKVQAVLDSIDALSGEMLADVSAGFDNYYYYAVMRNLLTCFSRDYGFDMVDLTDLATYMALVHLDLAEDLTESISDLVVYNRTNMDGAGGVSIYYPYDDRETYLYEAKNSYAKMGMPDNYVNYLSAFSNYWVEGGTPTVMESEEEAGEGGEEQPVFEDEVVIQLTDEQLDTMVSLSYTVMMDTAGILGDTGEAGLYTPVLINRSVEPDENGQIHIPMSVELFYMQGENTQPWIVQQVDETDEAVDFVTVDTALGGPAIFADYFDKQEVQIRFRVYKQDESIEILSINAVNDESTGAGKSDIDVTDYDTLYYSLRRYEEEDNPYTDWETYDSSIISLYDFFGTVTVELGTSDTTIYPVVCQAVMEDVSGNLYYSGLYEMNWNDRDEIRVETENGEMVFADQVDSVALTDYIGTDTELEIPESVSGLPVTTIENQAFMYNETLRSVTIPGSVTDIGWEAFCGCIALEDVVLNEGLETIAEAAFADCEELVSINIPASVTEIGVATFGECYELTGLTVAQNSASFRMVDGLLLSADGTIVVSYTAAADDICVIPDGVTEIAAGAFAYCLFADQVILPEGLERIGNFAFFENPWLRIPDFPDSLTSIGNGAFNMGEFAEVYNSLIEDWELPEEVTVTIGANLTHINQTAFSDGIYEAFVVDPENPYYASVDGNLTNKAGDYIICEAYGGEE